ncbi:MAG: calcium/sodium antiporter [Cytophagales bacterium]|nr:calcium/sodium antiporter [Cytophagales bacterium]
MALSILTLIAGFGLLIFGANLLVTGASGLARKWGVSDLVVGLTVVAFGTSLPELTVNSFNSMAGMNEAVFGNIIGSNIFNVALILGIVGLIYPIKVERRSVAYEIPFSIVVSLVLVILLNDHLLFKSDDLLSRWDAVILLLLFVCFAIYIFKSTGTDTTQDSIGTKSMGVLFLFMVGGLTLLVSGGYLTTESAVNLAEILGMSETLIALTILSIGTSLPELVTSSVAAFKRNADIAVGNVIGSNIFNISFILGVSGVIHPVAYDNALNKDIFVMILASGLLMVAMFSGGKMKLDRWEAVILLACYVMYSIFIILRN